MGPAKPNPARALLAALAASVALGACAESGESESDGEAEAAEADDRSIPVLQAHQLKRDAGAYRGRTVALEGLVGEVLAGGYLDIGAGAQDVIAITGDRTVFVNAPVDEGDPVRVTGRVEPAADHLLGRRPFTFVASDPRELLRSDYSGEPVLLADRVRAVDADPADFPEPAG